MQYRENQIIHGEYHGVPYAGTVRNSRVKYGGVMQHTVDLMDDIQVHNEIRTTILVNEHDNFSLTIKI
jgi:hypothetical protein